jgi:hypothetical protein
VAAGSRDTKGGAATASTAGMRGEPKSIRDAYDAKIKAKK